MNFRLVSYLCILTAATAVVGMFSSCNKEDVITVDAAPHIILDSETGVYTVKIGQPLTITPIYQNVGGDAVYTWMLDGQKVGASPSFSHTWTSGGEYYLTLSVTTDAGTASEELRVDVVDLCPPSISLPIAGDVVSVAVGTDFVLQANVAGSDIEDFSMQWTINGQPAGNGEIFNYHADLTGDYNVVVSAYNIDGTDERSFTLRVLEKLPYTLEFPTPSYFCTSTTRYTFAGRGVYLTPLMSGLAADSFLWSVNGVLQNCDEQTFVFTPEEPGEYNVGVTVDGLAATSVLVVCVDATEAQRMRPAGSSSSMACTTVFEWVPAPGQFIGETQTGGMTGNETTLEAANSWAEMRLESGNYVSLGGFGGYIIVGFDHSIPAGEGGDYDFAVQANAFLNAGSGEGGSNEPGIVWVMQDVNGNGIPDDEWYELRGSDSGVATTLYDYAVTYYRPAAPRMPVQWTDNIGNSGTIDYLAAFHRQDYYYPAWIEADSYTLRGTRLKDRTTQNTDTGLWDNSPFDWGYVDNIGADNLGAEDANTGQGQRNGFLIKNAMQPDHTSIKLQYVDFVKIQTGVNSKAGWLGEVSTEVCGVAQLK